jgi:hypothetical protein
VTRSEYRNPLNLSNAVDYEAMVKNGWLDQGAFYIKIDDDCLNWVERQLIENVATRIYGKRRDAE